MCAGIVEEYKKKYSHIKSTLVLAYMPKDKEEYDLMSKTYDDTIYPDLENTPLRFAIVNRNKWMVDNSDYLIAYVERTYGGAV